MCIHVDIGIHNMCMFIYIYTCIYTRPQILSAGEEKSQIQTQPDRVQVETRVFLSGVLPTATGHPEENAPSKTVNTIKILVRPDATQKLSGNLEFRF